MEEIKLTLDAAPVPSLTLDEPVEEAKPVVKEEEEIKFTPEEQKLIDDFSEKIDLTNSGVVMQYGVAAQKKIAGFSDNALQNVKTKDLGEVGGQITSLITELRGFEIEEEDNGFFGFFKKQANKVTALKAKYEDASKNIQKIVDSLEGHQIQLMKDVVMLDKLYETNLAYHKELTMYIYAGKKKLEKERSTTLVALKEKAARLGTTEAAQAANDFAQHCDGFEKKIHDLELTKMVSIQMSPQIRLVQNNDKLMADKIQSTIVNTIPLWKSQMVLAMGMAHSSEAIKAQREVSDMTNELLKKNADTLKMNSIEAAKESERGVVDMETLRHTNQSLISTLDEVVKIQEEGKARRKSAEIEIQKLETELKTKLLDIRS